MNRVARRRAGFTLVELLVVIVIIGMLMGLLTPAIIAAREKARQGQCTNNQKNLGGAVGRYELNKQHFPGYVNRIPGSVTQGVSWLVVILKELDRTDLWDAWREAKPAGNAAEQQSFEDLRKKRVGLFVCPSDDPTDDAPLSYVANCGQQDQNAATNGLGDKANNIPPDWPANGVFHRRYSQSNPNDFIRVSVSMSDIKDGAQHTLLLSENVQAGEWSSLPDWDKQEMGWGMVWWPNYDATDSQYNSVAINAKRDEVTGSTIKTARPSSYHPGGVIATFCDGHTQFISEDIDYGVYSLLMTPDGANAKIAGTTTSAPPQAALDEADFQ